ncbi:MAG: response regulator transcription factor [Dehalococcoidia bacterium]
MGERRTVLVVDDERPLVTLLTGYFEREGYRVLTAEDGPTALKVAQADPPDVIVLDVMLPGLDGIEVCRRLRQVSDVYIIMLTARAEETDTLIGLAVGADDYVTKPFSPREVIARAKALLRRPRATSPDLPPPQRVGDLVIDRARYEATKRGETIPLTPREFSLLANLAKQPGRVFSRAHLLDLVWGESAYDDHVVEVHIANLRRKLEDDPQQPRYIQTVRGVGYRFGILRR